MERIEERENLHIQARIPFSNALFHLMEERPFLDCGNAALGK